MPDIAQVFDKLEWSFVENCLYLYNFGQNLISTLKPFHNQSFSKVEENDVLLSNINLSCVCRQRDHLLPYIFVIFSEILSQMFRGSDGVKGIEILGCHFKLSQYVDNT